MTSPASASTYSCATDPIVEAASPRFWPVCRVAEMEDKTNLRALPSVDQLLRLQACAPAIERFGRPAVTSALREALSAMRDSARQGGRPTSPEAIVAMAIAKLDAEDRAALRPVFN